MAAALDPLMERVRGAAFDGRLPRDERPCSAGADHTPSGTLGRSGDGAREEPAGDAAGRHRATAAGEWTGWVSGRGGCWCVTY